MQKEGSSTSRRIEGRRPLMGGAGIILCFTYWHLFALLSAFLTLRWTHTTGHAEVDLLLHLMKSTKLKGTRPLMSSDSMGTSAVSLLCNCKFNTLTLRQRDPWLLRTNDENIALPSSKRIVDGILNVNNVEASIMTLTVSDDTNTAHITSTSNHSNHTSIELDKVGNLAGGKIDLHSVVDFDGRVRVTDTTWVKFCKHYWRKYTNRWSSTNLLGKSTKAWTNGWMMSDRTYVLASCVTKNGIPPLPNCTLLTFPSLYSASSAWIRWTVKRPLVS